MSRRAEKKKVPGFGVNLTCFASQVFGIAESAKQLAYAFQAAEIPFVINDVALATLHSRCDSRLEPYVSADNPYSVNIIHLNPPEAEWFFTSRPSSYFQDRANIGVWYWELTKIPLKWSHLFKFYDEIWATSAFIQQTLSRASSAVPVQKIPFPLTVDTKITTPARERFGLKEGSCAFLFAFDYASEFERKNPLAVVQTFRRAFDNKDDALLIINTVNSHTDAENSRRLWEAARGARIFILDGHLTRPDYYALLVACNCYVSLHRAEGLGMTMAQAMYFGKPVIATGYSGNLDFMNKDNSLLVDFNLVEFNRDYGPNYEKGNVWAEPNVDQASEFMRWIYEHPSKAKALGEVASRDVRESMNPKVVGWEIRSRLRKMIEARNARVLYTNAHAGGT